MKSAIEVIFSALDHRQAEGEHQDRADIDAEIFEPPLRRQADTAEIGPGCAVDSKTQRIDERPAMLRRARLSRSAVAIARHCEKQQQVGEGYRCDDRSREHAPSMA